MEIELYRVDERLVHGQIIASWSKYLGLKRIIIVDDQLAKDDFMRQVLTMAAPAGIQIEVMSVEKAAERIVSDSGVGEKAMILFKRLKYALSLSAVNPKIKELNLGNIGAGPSRKAITKNVFLSPEEKEMIHQLQKNEVSVYLQMLYSDAKIDVSSKI